MIKTNKNVYFFKESEIQNIQDKTYKKLKDKMIIITKNDNYK